mmetsp:Transcript_34145/g.80367  ORF Transcript_34145/g.80367 Transcript_34145/m.80367 type:complete len:214 (+) Transcript_34145:546-1187(+)
MNRHLVLFEQLVRFRGANVEKIDHGSRGNRQNQLLGPRKGSNLHVPDFGSLLRVEGGYQRLFRSVPEVNLSVHAGTQQEIVRDPRQFRDGGFLREFQRRTGGGRRVRLFLLDQDLWQLVDSQGRLLSAGRQSLRVGREHARLDNVLVGQFDEALAGNGVPHAGRVVAGRRRGEISGGVHLARPNRTLVSHPGSDPVPGCAVANHGHFVVASTQ